MSGVNLGVVEANWLSTKPGTQRESGLAIAHAAIPVGLYQSVAGWVLRFLSARRWCPVVVTGTIGQCATA